MQLLSFFAALLNIIAAPAMIAAMFLFVTWADKKRKKDIKKRAPVKLLDEFENKISD